MNANTHTHTKHIKAKFTYHPPQEEFHTMNVQVVMRTHQYNYKDKKSASWTLVHEAGSRASASMMVSPEAWPVILQEHI